MSRLLVLGVAPLPTETTDKSFGPGTRTWQIVEPLLADGHEVELIGMRIPGTYPEGTPPELSRTESGLTYASVDGGIYFQTRYVREAYERLRPEAVIFAHGAASFEPSLLDPDVPVWIDLCGHVMAEAQAKAAVYDDDFYLEYFYRRAVPALFSGDRFSTVSDAQGFALIGELGLAGRLNARTNGVDLVHTIPCGVEETPYVHERTVLRGVDVDDDAFIVLWSGGFNTWTDVDTMFEGLVYAMERAPEVRFVATGGQIDGHDEITYPRFVDRIESSSLGERFVLKGWLPRDRVPNYYFEADVGINCEKDIVEVRLGSKHRILDWSRACLPVVSTRVTELSLAVEEDGVGFVCDPGDPRALGNAILDAVRHRDELPALGERCREAMLRRYGFAASTVALRAWADRPEFAPDRGRTPCCLEAQFGAQGSPSAPPAEPRPAAAEAAPPAPEAVPVSEPPPDETRIQWLARVIRTSWHQGGPVLVVRRLARRLLTGHSATVE